MRYESQRFPRRSIRLKGYAYAQPGAYFVIRCTHKRAALFGSGTDGVVVLNPCAAIGEKEGFKPVVLRPEVRWEGMDMEEKTLAAIRRYNITSRGGVP
jgi:hypothetical protein